VNGSFPQHPTNNEHNFVLWSSYDNHYYTHYHSGEIVKINPQTWVATIVGYVAGAGQRVYTGAINPDDPAEMWMGWGYGGHILGHSLARLRLDDTRTWEEAMLEMDPAFDFDLVDPPYGTGATGRRIMYSFEKMSGPTSGGHRDGPLADAQFRQIRQISFDPTAGVLYVADEQNHCMRMVNIRRDGMPVSTMIGIPGSAGGEDGNREEARFSHLHGIVADADGVVYISDWGNNKIRRVAVE
jgi:hypothetical protein